MDKFDSLYSSFLKEHAKSHKTEKVERLLKRLKADTKVEIDEIDRILGDAISEAEENGFRNGARYAFELFAELSDKQINE